MRTIFTFCSLIPLCFAGGWLIGKADLTGIKKAITDSYLNRYNAATGTGADEVIYFVVSEDQTELNTIANSNDSIRLVESSGYPRLFNVYINYADRLQTLKALRSLATVSAVFTVPLICH